MIDYSKELDEQFNKILNDLPDISLDKPEKINTLKRRGSYSKRFLTYHQVFPYIEYADWHLEDRQNIADMTEQDLFDELGIKNNIPDYE